MKKQTILKVLSFVVLLTLVLSAVLLSGCNEEIKADVETTKTELEAVQAALKKAEDAIEALKTAAAKLDEDSATKAALTDKAAELQAAIDANAKTLKELKDTLVELGNSGATKDALAALETRVKALEDDLAAKATTITTLTEGLAAANTKIADDKTELANAIAEAKDAIAKLDEKYATDAELEAAINVLKANEIKALNDAIDAVKADYVNTQKLNDEIAKINTAIETLQTTSATKTELQTAIDGLKDEYVTKTDAEALKTAIEAISGEGITAESILKAISFRGVFEDYTTQLANDEYEFSFYKFIKKVNEFDSSDPTEYMYHATALELELARATCEKEAKDVFAKLDALQEEYKSYLGQLKAAIAALKKDGITRDTDLTKLTELRTEAQKDPAYNSEENKSVEEDYQAILDARQRLNDAFADATTAAEKAVELKLLAKDDDGNYILGDEILYNADVKTNIDTVKALYDTIEETYFKDAKMTALYKDKTMNDLPGYKLFTDQANAYDALQKAREELGKVELSTLPTVTVNPLFSQLGTNEEGNKSGILGDIAAIEKWAEDNKIAKDSENFTLIVNDFLKDKNENVELTVAKVEELRAYAAAMTGIYTDEVKALKDQIEKVIKDGATDVRWTDVEWPDAETPGVLDTMFNAIDALKADVAKVPGYTAADGNVNAMLNLNDAGWADLADIQARIALLKNAKKAVDELNTKIEARIGHVDLGDMELIQGWEKALDDIFNVDFADADDAKKNLAFDAEKPESANYINYLAMTETARKNLKTLEDEYAAKVSKLQDVYDVVRDAINGDKVYLTDLAKILWANKKVVEIELSEGIQTNKDRSKIYLDNGNNGKITYLSFQAKLFAKVVEVVELAEGAQDKASKINAFAENFNLNMTGDYQKILEDVLNWIETYLGVKYEGKLEDRIAAFVADEATQALFVNVEYDKMGSPFEYDENGNRIEVEYDEETGKRITKETGKCAILGIANMKNDSENYTFITDISGAIAAANTMNEKLAAAKVEWADIVAAYEALVIPEELDIHDETINAAYELYKGYETKYYAGEIVNAQFDELTLFNTGIDDKAGLKTLKANLDAKVKAATDLYDSIMKQAKDLKEMKNTITTGIPDESPEGIKAVLDMVKALQDDMATYRKDYCGKNDTDQCMFIEKDADGKIVLDAEFIAYKAKAKAFIVKVFVEGDNKDTITYTEGDVTTVYDITNDSQKVTLKVLFCIYRIDAGTTKEDVDEYYNLFLDISLKSKEEGVNRADYVLEVVAES